MSTARTNSQWLHDLRAGGQEQENAITDLRQLMLRAALYFFTRNLGDFGGLGRNEILQRAEDAAQDAVIALVDRLEDFRGDSQFTTWAYKFAINKALMAARRERVRGFSLDDVADENEQALSEWTIKDTSENGFPEHAAARSEVRNIIRDVIDTELTDKQRRVLYLMAFNDVPMDEVVRELDSNRNAIYKLLHDARQKLKDGLEQRGFGLEETLALFAISG